MKRPTETIVAIKAYIQKYHSCEALHTKHVQELLDYIDYLERGQVMGTVLGSLRAAAPIGDSLIEVKRYWGGTNNSTSVQLTYGNCCINLAFPEIVALVQLLNERVIKYVEGDIDD